MAEMAGALVFIVIVAIGGFVVAVITFMSNYLKAEPNTAIIITGRRYRHKAIDRETGEVVKITRGWKAIVGGGVFRWPVIEKVNQISLELINLANVQVIQAYSAEGVAVTIDAVANVKIAGEDELLARAVERFLGTSREDVSRIIKETLEGQLRDIVGNLTVEQLYQERESFVEQVLAQAADELGKIGVIIDIINIQDIKDDQGYLAALGEKRTAEVKRDAQKGRAEAKRDADVFTAEQIRQTAEAEKTRDVAIEQYRGQTFAAQAKADQQGPLSEAQARQEVVKQEQMVFESEEIARRAVEEARAAAEEQKYKANVVVPAEADKLANILRAEGEAQAVIKKKDAEAKGIQMVYVAEAAGLREKAEAWNSYKDPAKLNLVLEAMKEMVGPIAASLGNVKFDKIVAIGGGSGKGGNPLADIINIAPAALVRFFEEMKAATGIDPEAYLQRIMEEGEGDDDGKDKKAKKTPPKTPASPEGGGS